LDSPRLRVITRLIFLSIAATISSHLSVSLSLSSQILRPSLCGGTRVSPLFQIWKISELDGKVTPAVEHLIGPRPDSPREKTTPRGAEKPQRSRDKSDFIFVSLRKGKRGEEVRN
jgi:hypothetical protein